ncbi:MAG: hypothetical protein K5923_05970 [Clostridia bacterium]|nr:hypothetical protein [Clostridia bacterium]
MKRLTLIICIILALFVFTSCNEEKNEPTTPILEGYQNNLLMVYFCGSDLESRNGRASDNIDELLSASIPSNTTVVIQTGGAQHWEKDGINANSIGRYEIKNGALSQLESLQNNSMGNKDTLQSFLEYCNTHYVNTKKALILWNHGGGPIQGCCFDEIFNNDSLDIGELSNAITGAQLAQLDFIGFDACLMGSFEVAYALKDYSKYMIASEESEPGRGWDYKAIAESYGKDPLETTLNVAVDSYYAKCEKYSVEMNATLAAIDLSKMDSIAGAFEMLFSDFKRELNNIGIWQISNAASSAHTFGGRTIYEKKTNIVDLYGFVDNLKIDNYFIDEIKGFVSQSVVKKKNGVLKEGSGGLSFYYPCTYNAEEVHEAQDVVVTESYRLFIAENFVNAPSNLISFEDRGSINDHGAFEIKISNDSVKYVRSVKYSLYEFITDGDDEYVPAIGTDVDIYNDAPGVYSSNFKGRWVTFNGVELQCNYLGESNGYAMYSSRVIVNHEDKFLRFAYSYKTREFELLGTWSGINEQGMADKTFDALNEGDIFIPVYYIYDANFNRTILEGDPITITKNMELSIAPLKQTYYQYAFVVEDIFGRLYYSYSAVFKMKYTYDELLNNPLTGKYDFAADITAVSDSVTVVL